MKVLSLVFRLCFAAALWWAPTLAVAAPAIEISDDLDLTVKLARPAQRIVALAPHLVENLYAIGAGERIVGTVEWADYPPAAKSIPRIGNYKVLSSEAVLALRPDLVLVWASGNGQGAMRRLQGLGLTVYASEPRSLDSVAKTLLDLGRLTGRDETAAQVASDFTRRLGELRARSADRSPVSVFYQVWHEPLQTINGDHLISAVIRLCGGRNVFGGAAALAPKVSIESVLAANPQVIVTSDAGYGFSDFWAPWENLDAVRNQRLRVIDAGILQRHTVRILDGAAALCAVIDEVRN